MITREIEEKVIQVIIDDVVISEYTSSELDKVIEDVLYYIDTGKYQSVVLRG